MPFLLSAVLVLVGLWVRTDGVGVAGVHGLAPRRRPRRPRPLPDQRAPRRRAFPLGTLVARHPRRLLLGTGAAIGGSAVY
ncbi:hypothetical protein [Streptomyces stelliscabiei]|uniref:hypothetical protein n=1 Tax=Streptomyces stelliscabiei TaxID=146820 RepID=UPI002FF173F6